MRYFVIDVSQLITPVRNNIFPQNLVFAFAVYWGLSALILIQIRSVLTFLLHNVYLVTFFRTQCGFYCSNAQCKSRV